MIKFISFLSPQIESFIRYRKVSKNWNNHYEQNLKFFDRYCAETYPDSEVLSQKMVDSWCKKRNSEKNNSCRTRIHAVVGMIKYLRLRGETNVNPPILPRQEHRTYIPHSFTESELANFFNACDSLPATPNRLDTRSRNIQVPVLFRLLYSSGIRTCEARMLRVIDVDLQSGILNIQYSKGHDQHYVALHDSMLALMKQYDDAIKKLYHNRAYFFPSLNGKSYHDKVWLVRNFKHCWYSVNTDYAIPYMFRHNYAVSNINSWVDMGLGFDDKLHYLSKSMGHRCIESTKYYYSLTPVLAEILEEKTNVDFERIVPEVSYEKSE